MRHAILPLLCSALFLNAEPASLPLVSPGRNIQMVLSADAQNHLVYSVTDGEHPRVEQGRLGIVVDGSDLGEGVVIGTPQSRRHSGRFPWRGNKRLAAFDCIIYEVPIRARAGSEWILEARVFDDGLAFRYRVPGDGTRRISGETTSWQLPGQCIVWFQTNTGDYEGVYQSRPVDQLPLEETVENKPRPLFFGPPVTISYSDGSFGILSEAALYSYSGMTLRPAGGRRFNAAFQDDPQGWTHEGPIQSPWRVLILGKDLNALVNNDLIAAVCEPPDETLFPQGLNTSWIAPGKAPCTWMVFGNDGAQWHRQKWFVDLCSAMGSEYLLVDAGWRTERWGWLKDGGDVWARAAELCRYAAERNVGIILWHAYPEGRDDGPGLTTVEAREELFRNCQKAGVKGVKIDFFNSESKQTIEAYEDLLRRAAKYQLTVNFHGANKPTGELRTWPNEIAREGIREQEYVLWGSLPLEHYGALPFTRMAVGHADFLPGYVQPKTLRNTTAIFQMASVVVYSSPFLCWPDNPEAYLETPLVQFVRTVPVVWDETRILPGSKIGDTVIMARRNGEEWYLAVLNCRSERQKLEVDLSFAGLSGKELDLYLDAEHGTGCAVQSRVAPPEKGIMSISLRPGGGFLARVASPKPYRGWAQ